MRGIVFNVFYSTLAGPNPDPPKSKQFHFCTGIFDPAFDLLYPLPQNRNTVKREEDQECDREHEEVEEPFVEMLEDVAPDVSFIPLVMIPC